MTTLHYPDPGLPLRYSGKVRDLYTVDAEHYLIVATDRLSAFDVVLPDPIPGKGVVLTTMANFWFRRYQDLIVNHLDLAEVSLETTLKNDAALVAELAPRSVIARRLSPLPIEAIVRGYIAGSAWAEYQRSQSISGIELPAGLQQAQRLAEPVFTPSTKATIGNHDENISFAQAESIVGAKRAAQIRDISLALYRDAAAYAEQRGIIIADSKFEFGLDARGNLVLIDEILTPDSSRFWPLIDYCIGTSPPSLDKQFVRDYLLTLDWDRTAPGPRLPAPVITKTSAIYSRALALLTDE